MLKTMLFSAFAAIVLVSAPRAAPMGGGARVSARGRRRRHFDKMSRLPTDRIPGYRAARSRRPEQAAN